MENAILVALAHQNALERHLTMIANNMANMNTAGFKRGELMFSDYLAPGMPRDRRSDPPPVFVRDYRSIRDTIQGELQETENPLDVALQGEGYFVVQGPDGERYTRDGHFRLDETGQLVTEQGLPVLSSDGQPITFTQQETQIAIAGDGSINTRDGPAGRLRVVRFSDPQSLEALAGGLFRATSEAPKDVDRPFVVQGMLEASNVQPIVEMEEMMRVHRAYQQAQNLLERENDRIRKAIEVYSL